MTVMWVRLSTDWMLLGLNPGGDEILRTCPDRPWGRPTFLYGGYQVLPEGKVAGSWRRTPTPSSAEVKERVGYISVPPVYIHGVLQSELCSWPLLMRVERRWRKKKADKFITECRGRGIITYCGIRGFKFRSVRGLFWLRLFVDLLSCSS
jgi:hypothetical protein